MDEAGAAANVGLEKPKSIKELEAKRNDVLLRKKKVVSEQRYEDTAKLRDEEKKIDDQLINALS